MKAEDKTTINRLKNIILLIENDEAEFGLYEERTPEGGLKEVRIQIIPKPC